MTTYNIDYSDPLRTGFSINPGEFNGPGGVGVAQTSLRLYGRGALEWGESVDENLVRLNENFAGATAPRIPLAGQLWLRQVLYIKVGSTFYRRNITAGTWATITVTTTVDPISGYPNGTALGSYVYSSADNKLYRWDSSYKQALASWLPREFSSQAGAPTTQVPSQDLLFYDENTATWVTPRATSVGIGVPPAGTYDGQFYYDTSTGILYIWNEGEGEWQQILGPANVVGAPPGGNTTTSNGNIDMQNLYTIVNLLTPTDVDLDYAANVGYVQSYVSTALSGLSGSLSGLYVPLTGGATMTGAYAVTGSFTATTSIQGGSLTSTGATNVNGVLTIGATMNANSQRISNVAAPTVGADAANMTYVQAQDTATANSVRAAASLVNPASWKDGDIHIAAGKIYIYMYGYHRQVWPAQYS